MVSSSSPGGVAPQDPYQDSIQGQIANLDSRLVSLAKVLGNVREDVATLKRPRREPVWGPWLRENAGNVVATVVLFTAIGLATWGIRALALQDQQEETQLREAAIQVCGAAPESQTCGVLMERVK